MNKRIHVIVNSHLDPVWLWNRSSGRAAWSNTAGTVVRLMREFPEMTFSCSAAALYRWIEETEPKLFADIRALVREGRWEIVGGWEVQSDTVIASAESLRRQGISGRRYFQEKFGVEVRIGYSVDAFGHAAELPRILQETGFTHYVYMRGQETPVLFRWLAPNGASVIAHHLRGGYCFPPTLSREAFFRIVQTAAECDEPARSLFFGVGDHGGALSREYLHYLQDAAKEFPLEFSTLERFFAENAADASALPEISGELGPVFRGCYSANHRVKQAVAATESLLLRAETLGGERVRGELEMPWRETLFANFHDVLPGTCIREVYERDILPALGGAASAARTVIDRETARLAAEKLGTADGSYFSEGGIFACNPRPQPQLQPVSFPAFSDPNGTGREFNALAAEDGTLLPLQILPSPTSYGPYGVPWGNLTAVLPLAAHETKIFGFARTEKNFPDVGVERQLRLLDEIAFQVYFDDTGTWGFTLTGHDGYCETAERTSVRTVADGPAAGIVEAQYRFRNSRITLRLTAYREIPELSLDVECDWHEPFTALKLAWRYPSSSSEFFRGGMIDPESLPIPVSGLRQWRNGRVERHPASTGELAMHRWCAVRDGGSFSGLASPDLHGCDVSGGALRVTLLRCLAYADHKPFPVNLENGLLDEGRTTYEIRFFSNLPEPPPDFFTAVEWQEVSPRNN